MKLSKSFRLQAPITKSLRDDRAMSQVSTRQRTAWQRATTQPRHQTSSKFIKGHQTVSSKFIKPYEFSIEILCYGRQAFEIGGACPSLTTPQLGVWCFPESLNRKMSQLPPGGRHIFLPCRFLVYRIVEPQEAGEQWFELDWKIQVFCSKGRQGRYPLSL